MSDIRNMGITIKIKEVSTKLLLKTIYGIFYEKAINSKDSKLIENQTLVEYLYDSFFHKYGIASLSEKKVREILVTVKSERQMPKLSMIASFFWMQDQNNYSVDDLKFFFNLNRNMVIFNVFESLTANRREYNFEWNQFNAIMVISVIQEFFANKYSESMVVETIEKFKESVWVWVNVDIKEFENEDFPILVNSELIQEWFIKLYIENKRTIVSDLIEKNLIPKYILNEFDEQISESDKYFFVLNSLITEEESKAIFIEWINDISEEITASLIENSKFNQFEYLLIRNQSFPEVNRKYKIETIVSLLFGHNFMNNS